MTLIIDQNFTKNCEPRADGKTIHHLILHYTGCSARMAAARFVDHTPNLQGGRLSPHYMVDENGRVTQFVHEKMRAWHAGKSYWQGETDINSTSIGIEIVNMGEFAGYPDFNPDQIAVVIDLCRDILKRNPGITPFGVLGHSDIAPGRKLDPGPKFPWAQLAGAGVGYFPLACHPGRRDAETRDLPPVSFSPTGLSPTLAYPLTEAGDTTDPLDIKTLDPLLTQFGYNPDAPLDDRIDAFCMHYGGGGLTEQDQVSMITGIIEARENYARK